MEDQQAINVIETALLCADTPMSVSSLQKLFEPDPVTVEQVRTWLDSLQMAWHDRGLELAEISTGWRFQSRASMQRFLEQINPERAPKYSRAVLETLAIIAWKQPVTRGDIESIRGVTVSSQIVKTLEERGWVEVLGHRDGPGRPALLGTTKQFLDDLGLRALDELPALQPLAEQAEQEPQLELDGSIDLESVDQVAPDLGRELEEGVTANPDETVGFSAAQAQDIAMAADQAQQQDNNTDSANEPELNEPNDSVVDPSSIELINDDLADGNPDDAYTKRESE